MNKQKNRKPKLLQLNAETLRTLSGGASAPIGGGGVTPLGSSCRSGCLSLSHGPKPYTCVPCAAGGL